MSSRASAGAVLFVIAVGALGAYSAYRDGAFAPSPAQPDATASQESAAAEPAAEASGGTAASSADATAASTDPAPGSGSTDEAATGAADATAGDGTTAGTQADTASGPDATAQTAGGQADPQPDGSASGSSTSSEPASTASSSAPAGTASGASSSGQGAETAAAGQDTGTETVETFELQTPTYDIVRIEPSGDAVIAGKASPGATIELRANGEVIASTTANQAGEWVIVLDRPLAPGTYDIALHSDHEDADAPKASADRLAVSIPESGNETPLVALSRPDQPVEVLQKPEAQVAGNGVGNDSGGSASTAASGRQVEGPTDTSGAESQTAGTATAEAPVTAPSTAGDGAADSEGDDTVIARLKVSEETLSVPRDPSGQSTVDSQPQSDTAAAASGQGTDASQATADPSRPAPAGGEEGDPSATRTAAPTDVASADLTGTGGNAEIARAGDGSSGDAVTPPSVPVTIESAELTDDNRFIVKGTSEPGANIWIYLDEDFVGAVRAGGSGRWTFETAQDLDPGRYTIRADQVRNMEGAVAARAEVPFGYAGPAQVAEQGEIGSRGDAATSDAPVSRVPQVEILGSDDEGVRVLVRRGDALWTIARHFYGDGFRYTTIYQANDGQIRDPDLIYPGQVFVLPGLTESEVLDAQGG
ncbi:LysM peptidoglycan-binding domain-containing protein [Amorphus orientalis]|uniref:Nucleoid-associated protein YgaU n=1 Tax=Amorphus orientalis TaxID=649198 RepID=A0AAE3VQE7_9HYPH|nr:LysM peptidoglycan-binding domain-containing protein [Amorphus orientalis]MDQ0316442.1 nucleoid-associated protein YgaU [Amorphus orientalis]